MEKRGSFGSRFGAVAAVGGSVIGLGNIWRFPYIAGENGGAVFILIYLSISFLISIPIMLSEFSIGRSARRNSMGAFAKLAPGTQWKWVGYAGILTAFIILSFYCVIGGWAFEFFKESVFNQFQGKTPDQIEASFKSFVACGWRPIIWTILFIIASTAIILAGVQQGIERYTKILMPILFVLLLGMAINSLTLEGAQKGITFLLKPDFSKVTGSTVLQALGQSFFSMSLGMGILVTYSSYYPNDIKLIGTSFTVTGLNFLVAFMMGLIIFPAVMSFNVVINPDSLSGTTLVFVTLPEVFNYMDMPRFWAVLFFTLLFLAAVTSTISIAEVSIAFVRDRFHTSRLRACLVVLLPVFATSAVCSLSLGAVPGLKIAGMTVFDFLDTFTTNVLLPVSAFCICVYVGWVLRKKFIIDELSNYGSFQSRLAPVAAFLIKWVCPLLIAAIFLFYIASLL